MSTTSYSNYYNGFYYSNYVDAPPELQQQLSEEGAPYGLYNAAIADWWAEQSSYDPTITGFEVTLTGGDGNDGHYVQGGSYTDGTYSYQWEETWASGTIGNYASAWGSDADGVAHSAVNSGNSITFDGGAGNDQSWAYTDAYSGNGASATTSGNTTLLQGGLGADGLSARFYSDANQGGTSLVSGNTAVIEGGDGDDGRGYYSYWRLDSDGNEVLTESNGVLWSGIQAHAYNWDNAGVTSASTVGNSLIWRGGEGNDAQVGYLAGSAYYDATATVRDNTLLLSGDGGNDDLSFYFWQNVYGGGTPSRVTIANNIVTLDGGAGADTLRYYGGGWNEGGTLQRSGNVVTFDGGTGEDRALFFGRLADYQPALGADGTVILTDPRTGEAITVKNVESFLFGDGSFDPSSSSAFQTVETYSLEDILSLFNSDPVAQADSGTTNQNTVLKVGVAAGLLANDSDADNDGLAISKVNGEAAHVGQAITLASGAKLTVNADGSYSYDPNGQFVSLGLGAEATEAFTYTVSDGQGGTDTETVTLTVSGLNDGPSARGESFGTVNEPIYEGWEYLVKVSDLLKNDEDLDAGDTLQFVGAAATGTTQGSVTVVTDVDGEKYIAYTYKGASLADGVSANAAFTYTIRDNHGAESTGTVDLKVTGLANSMILGTTGDDSTRTTGTDKAKDTIDGLNGNDTVSGLNGNDKLYGNNGNDVLLGGDAHDFLDGGRGDDRLEGGRGDDLLVGGLGADQFLFKPINGAVVSLGTDSITDFKQGVDKIVLGGGIAISNVDATQDLNANGLLDTVLTLSANGSVIGKVELYDVNHFGASDWLMV